MIKIIEITATMIIIMLGNKINDYYKADLIELHLLNGGIEYVKIKQNNTYSCPNSCKADHFHDTLVLDEINSNINYNIVYNDNKVGKITLNGVEIINAFEIIEKKETKKNKITKTERNQLDIKSFINKYN